MQAVGEELLHYDGMGSESKTSSPPSSLVAIVAPVVCTAAACFIVIAVYCYRRWRSHRLHPKINHSNTSPDHTTKEYDQTLTVSHVRGTAPSCGNVAVGERTAGTPDASAAAYAPINPCSVGARAAYAQAADATRPNQRESRGASHLCSTAPGLNSDATLLIDSSAPGSGAKPCTHRQIPPVPLPVGEDPTQSQLMEFLNQQLDCFPPDAPLLGKYILLGPLERRCGGM